MTTVIAHRGPDADGFYVGRGIGLGHRRLSIIDLSTGDQPLANEDGTIWVVFNGEIYNFAEIRAELERVGHHFRTHTDTEAIVHAYEEWGERARRPLPRACSPSRSGTSRGAGCCSSAIASASSRSTTAATAGGRHVRVGDQVDARGSRRPARLERRSARRLSHAAVRSLPADDLPRRSRSCRRATCSWRNTAGCSIAALLGPDVHRRRRRVARRRVPRPARRAARRIGAAAAR